MSERKIFNSSTLDKNLRIISAVIMCKHRGEYFNPRAVLHKSELADELKQFGLEDFTWIDEGIRQGYFIQDDYWYCLGKNGNYAFAAGGIAQFLQKVNDIQWEKEKEKRAEKLSKKLDYFGKMIQIAFWILGIGVAVITIGKAIAFYFTKH